MLRVHLLEVIVASLKAVVQRVSRNGKSGGGSGEGDGPPAPPPDPSCFYLSYVVLRSILSCWSHVVLSEVSAVVEAGGKKSTKGRWKREKGGSREVNEGKEVTGRKFFVGGRG